MEEVIDPVIAAELKAPRAGAIAGILFSILLITSLVLIRLSVPDSPRDPGTWLSHSAQSIRVALNLAALRRNRLSVVHGRAARPYGGKRRPLLGYRVPGQRTSVPRHDFRLFLSHGRYHDGLWVAPGEVMGSGIYTFARTLTYELVNVYALRMAGVFMFSTCTIALRIGLFPALDGVSRICGGDFSASEHRTFRLGSAGFSHVDFVD